MKKRTMALFLAGSLTAIALTGQTLAQFADWADMDVDITTGSVKIGLSTIREDGVEERTGIMPGDVVNETVTVASLEEPCYIRAQITPTGGMESIGERIYETLDYDRESWILKDGYLYLKEPLRGSGDEAVIYRSVTIPEDLGDTGEDPEVTVNVKAEAIQAAGITPDLESEKPWGDAEILAYAGH